MSSKDNVRSESISKVINAILAVLAAFALPYIVPMSNALDYTNSIWPVFVFAGAWWFFAEFRKRDFSGQLRYSLPLAIILSFFLVVGRQISENDLITKAAVFLILPIALLSFALYLFISQLMISMEKLGGGREERRLSLPERFFSLPYWPILSMSILILIWLPMWLGSWPGTFHGDIANQVVQYNTGRFLGNYPLMHTLIMGSIVCGVQRLSGSLAAGVAVYTGLQMIYLAAVFTYSIVFLKRRKAPAVVMLTTLVLYAVSPVILLYCKDTVRDVLFSSTILLFGILLSEVLLEAEDFFRSRLRVAALIITGFMAMSLRNAAPFLIVGLALVICIRTVVQRKSYRWKVILSFVAIIGAYTIWSIVGKGTLISEENHAESKEMLSIPIQQISCVAFYAQDSLTPVDRQMISELFPSLPSPYEWYDNDNVDVQKHVFNNVAFSSDMTKYTLWWASLCFRFPALTLGSFLRLNLEVWYPNTVFRSYLTPPWNPYQYESLYYAVRSESFDPEMSILPSLYRLQEVISQNITFSRIPLISMAFSPAFTMYILLLCVFYLAYQKRLISGVPVIVALMVQFATLFGPTVALRYYILTFFTLPISVALMFSPSLGAPE